MTDKETEQRLRYLEKQVTYLSIHLKLAEEKLHAIVHAADMGKMQKRIERLELRSKLMSKFIDKTVAELHDEDKAIKKRLDAHRLSHSAIGHMFGEHGARMTALESEQKILFAAYSKAHPGVMRELDELLGIKPKKKKLRAKKPRT